jgi:hypothetical protein
MINNHNVDKHGVRTPRYDPIHGIIHGFNHFVDSGEQLEKDVFSKLATVGRALPGINKVVDFFSQPDSALVDNAALTTTEDLLGGTVGLAWNGMKLLRHSEGMFGYTDTPQMSDELTNHDNYVGHQKSDDGSAIPYMPIGWDFEGLHNNTNMDLHSDPRSYPVNNPNRGHMYSGHSQVALL